MVFQRNRAGRRIYESLNWPSKARRWLPLRDHPRDGVMVAVRATFPSTYTVLANGRMESMRDNTDATRTWQYFCATPMPAYDIHVAAYDDWAETTARSSRMQRTVRWLPYATDREAGMTLLGELPAAMDFYEDTFGPFRWEQAVFLEVPIFGGGMEHATLVSMDESLFRSPARNRSVTFHELAHHWSGNLVRIATWNDFWLSEGVTDYLTGRFIETHDGAEAGRLHWREYLRQSIVAEAGTARHAVRPPDPEVDVLSIFDSVSYKKGAFVLRMLERRIGTEAFTRFLRDWFTRHATQAVTTATLEEELTEAFAMADVPSFFRQWMYTPAHPVIALDTRYDAAAGAVTLTARQMQSRGPGDGFTLPVEVEFSRGDMRTRTTVMLSGRSTTHTTPLRFEPERVVVDPDETAYLAVACTAGVSPCREGYVCAAPTAGASTVCLPARM
jgi:aminopeptidase N